MLIYQEIDKKDRAQSGSASRSQELKRTTTILTRINTNFLRGLGFKVKQYKKQKNE